MKVANPPNKFRLGPYALSLLITFSIAAVASYFTVSQIPGWYSALHKPSFNPPRQLFGPVWTLLYIMIATAAYLVWQRRDGSALYTTTRAVYFLQLFFNFAWSIVFFGLHQVLLALVVIALLWISIVVNMFYFRRFSKTACWLLLPYLLWVSFASILNLYIFLLNR
jgi:benzodiazapine receptor